jgi:hypothetical protein
MNWTAFLGALGKDPELDLTTREMEVILCIVKEAAQSTQQLLAANQHRRGPIDAELKILFTN